MHKRRVEERKADISSLIVPTWQDVLNLEYDEWDETKDGPVTVLWMDDGEKALQTCIDIVCGIKE